MGSGQAPAAHVEEVVGEVPSRRPEDLQPHDPGARPPCRAAQRLGTAGSERGTGHGSASRSILPEVRVGRVSTSASRGTRGAGSRSRSAAPTPRGQSAVTNATYPTRRVLPSRVLGRRPRPGTPGARAGRCRSRRARSVDLHLHLVVGPPRKPGPPRRSGPGRPCGMPAPSPGRHRGVLLGVLDGVEVPRQPDPADDQFPGLPRATSLPLASTTARSQPSRAGPMRTGASVQPRRAHATTVVSVGP